MGKYTPGRGKEEGREGRREGERKGEQKLKKTQRDKAWDEK